MNNPVILLEDLPQEMENYFEEIFSSDYIAGNIVLQELKEGVSEEKEIYDYLISNHPSLKDEESLYVMIKKK